MGKNLNRKYSKIETLEELYREQAVMDRMLDDKEDELYEDYRELKSFFSLSGMLGLAASSILGRVGRPSTSLSLFRGAPSTLFRGISLGYQLMRFIFPRKRR